MEPGHRVIIRYSQFKRLPASRVVSTSLLLPTGFLWFYAGKKMGQGQKIILSMVSHFLMLKRKPQLRLQAQLIYLRCVAAHLAP